MLELLQWIVIVLMGVALGVLLKERHEARLPHWLKDLQQEDLVSRSEFDQYHHRVIQMSQVQKDYFHLRIEELSQSMAAGTPSQPPIVNEEIMPEPPREERPVSSRSVSESAQGTLPVEVAMEWETESPGGSREISLQPATLDILPDEMDPAKRAIDLFREGKTIEQIAQELRIGRQEAQLLIRMAQFKSPFLAGV